MNQIKYNYYIILRPVPFGTLMYDTPNSLSPRTTTGLLLGGHLLLLLSMSQFDQLDQFDQPSMSQFDQFDQFDQPMCALQMCALIYDSAISDLRTHYCLLTDMHSVEFLTPSINLFSFLRLSMSKTALE